MLELLSSNASFIQMNFRIRTEITDPPFFLTGETPSANTFVQVSNSPPALQQAKDQIALLTAQRKVLAFRNLDFANIFPNAIISYPTYFGHPIIHPSAPPLLVNTLRSTLRTLGTPV